MLEVNNLVKTFFKGTVNEKTALRGIDLKLEEGDFCTIIGGNGAGKSTLLNSIAGVFPVDEGTIKIGDVDVTSMAEHKRAKYIGRVFQDPMVGTAGNMQIEENLILAMRRGKKMGLKWAFKPEERDFFKQRLSLLGLGPSLWWSTAVHHPLDGHYDKARTSPLGRTYSSLGSSDCRKCTPIDR